jgi:hypothetical protein
MWHAAYEPFVEPRLRILFAFGAWISLPWSGVSYRALIPDLARRFCRLALPMLDELHAELLFIRHLKTFDGLQRPSSPLNSPQRTRVPG